MELRTTQEGLPRSNHFKGGEVQAPLKDPHLWLQVQESPPTNQVRGRGHMNADDHLERDCLKGRSELL
eukprot:14319310-Heterocapsa_arctica.AAC.1